MLNDLISNHTGLRDIVGTNSFVTARLYYRTNNVF